MHQAKAKLPKEQQCDPDALAPLVFKDPSLDGPLFGWMASSIKVSDTLDPRMLGPILMELLFAEDPKRLVRLAITFPVCLCILNYYKQCLLILVYLVPLFPPYHLGYAHVLVSLAASWPRRFPMRSNIQMHVLQLWTRLVSAESRMPWKVKTRTY